MKVVIVKKRLIVMKLLRIVKETVIFMGKKRFFIAANQKIRRKMGDDGAVSSSQYTDTGIFAKKKSTYSAK